MRIGVFGGSFDPPHLGHLILADRALAALNLDHILWLPVADPPHKTVEAPIVHRVAMVERAVADHHGFRLSRVDIDRPGPHYSVDALKAIHQQSPGSDLYFIIGADSLTDLPSWNRPAELIEQAHLAVMRRPGTAVRLDAVEQAIPGLTENLTFFVAPLIEISSSDVRSRLITGQSVRYLVPPQVEAYIHAHNVYAR